MPLVEWNQDYATGIEEIDAQHKELFAIINSLGDAMRDKRAKEETGAIISRMAVYAGVHFRTEEEYFRRADYPGAQSHAAEHRKFVDRVMVFVNDFNEGRAALTLELLAFLGDWLGHHVKKSDMAYSPFLKARGF